MVFRNRHRMLLALAALAMPLLAGCMGVTHNPSYFPWILPTGDVIPTHAKPFGWGYYSNFDPYAKRLEVRPITQVVPVQTQHVIVATVYGIDKPLRKRRVEWYLQGEGNIVEVDESGVFPGRGYQKDAKSAVSYTDYGYNRLTRGNLDPNDDIMIRPGQSWCVVSSAVEGDTYVTVVAPGIYNWDNRKRVVNIKWVDAQWQFPENSQARTGAEQVLTTRVFRFTDKQPLANYKVRYRIVDGPPAILLPNQGQEAVVVSDLEGNASVAIRQTTPTLGANRVEVEIIRPPDPTKPSGTGIVLAKAVVVVEWLASKVELALTGPTSTPIGQHAVYSITVTNTGRIESEPMTVSSPIPDGMRFISATPTAVEDRGTLYWTLGPLPAGQAHPPIQVTFAPTKITSVRYCAKVQTVDGQTDEQCMDTVVTRPGLKVTVNGPAKGVVGVPVTFDVTITNPGTGPTSDIVVKAELSDGLEPDVDDPAQRKSRTVTSNPAPLAAGESRVIPLTVVPRSEGRQRVHVIATAAGNLRDEAQATIEIARPQIDAKLNGPEARYTGRTAEWNIRVVNPSDLPISKVTVRAFLPPELTYQSATAGGNLQGREVVWELGTLPAGRERVVQLTTRCADQPGLATQSIVVTADYGLRVEDSATLRIKPVPAALRLELVDDGDPVAVGQQVEYEVQVTNTGSETAKNVRVVTDIPAELKAVHAQGTSASQIQGRTVSFQKIGELPPGKTAVFRVRAEAIRPGDVRFAARLFADLLPQPVVETESTTIVDPRNALRPGSP